MLIGVVKCLMDTTEKVSAAAEVAKVNIVLWM
jgi:hypothetical protein